MIQMVLEKAPLLIQELGAAANQGLMPLAELGKGIGTGLGNIDKVNIVDLGGSKDGQGAVTRYAMTVPEVLFAILAKMKAVGIDVDALLKKAGIDATKVGELVGAQLDGAAAPTAPRISPEVAPAPAQDRGRP
jgi:hypothetical protein